MNNRENKAEFNRLNPTDWHEVFYDSMVNTNALNDGKVNKDYEDLWFLDGKVAQAENMYKGLQLTAGPQYGNDEHHMVLWTKKSFTGDLKIEFECTVTDFENRCVNIIYIQATGEETLGYAKDISTWNRDTPAMSEYFDKMNTYHISFAAYTMGNKLTTDEDYVRLRRYNPSSEDGLNNTDILPDYFNTGLFLSGVNYKIEIIKREQKILMRVSNENIEKYFAWENTIAPAITEGRVGLRLMCTRSSRFKNFVISQPNTKEN